MGRSRSSSSRTSSGASSARRSVPVSTTPPHRTHSSNSTSSTTTAAIPHPYSNMTPPQMAMPAGQGILGQIATTAAGVATGHVVGRMITGLFSGNSNGVDPAIGDYQQQQGLFNSTSSNLATLNGNSESNMAPQCQQYSKLFLQCMEQNDNKVSTCQDYLDMMKACQQQYAI